MESGLVVDMLISGTTENAQISTIIVDEDLTTICAIWGTKETRESDTNHAKKFRQRALFKNWIHSIQDWKTIKRYGVTRKRKGKRRIAHRKTV